MFVIYIQSNIHNACDIHNIYIYDIMHCIYHADLIAVFHLLKNSFAQFFICCPRDCVSRHNGGTSGAPFKPLRVDSALRTLSTLRGLRGAPEVLPLCRETQSLGQ